MPSVTLPTVYLLCDGSDVLQRERPKLRLLQVIIEVGLQQLEHQTDVATMCEALVSSYKVPLLAGETTELRQHAHLSPALPRIRGDVLQDL